ncbi:MAG: RNA-binding domain-containing protein [Candidatus Thermoplasmatota archaeon]|nr:RNA-binding domain-containing protein [Candidatus Thermoplasmatota archaeon]
MEAYSLEIEVPVFPTEEKERVEAAVGKLFPGTVLSEHEEEDKILLTGKTSNLKNIKDLLARQRIRDSARAFLFGVMKEGEELRFFLAKQPAYVGKINFVHESSPLGEIMVNGQGDHKVFIEWVTEIANES